MNRLEIQKKVEELSREQEWNHQYELPFGIKTRNRDINSAGYNINKWQRLLPILVNSIGNRIESCIDVGCSDGYYCVEGAKLLKDTHFTGLDLDPVRIERANFVKNVLEIKNVDFIHEDLYDLISKNLKFDLVMGLGLLHRVPDLDKCIYDLAQVSKKYIILEFKSLKGEGETFLDHGGKTKSNKLNGLYKTPTIDYVKKEIEKSGFVCTHVFEDGSSLRFPRTILIGEKSE